MHCPGDSGPIWLDSLYSVRFGVGGKKGTRTDPMGTEERGPDPIDPHSQMLQGTEFIHLFYLYLKKV